MLSELHDQQEGDGSVWYTDISVSVETRDSEGDELVHEKFKFSYAREWDKWTLQEYVEKRAAVDSRVSDRNWRQTRHLMWYDANETPEIDVPPEVADALSQATGGDVTLQIPRGSLNETEYEEVHTV